MTGRHTGPGSLHCALSTRLHATDATVKLVCLVGFLFAVVATPPRAVPAFGAYALMVGGAAIAARIPPGVLARRMSVEAPFVVFALALPFVGSGPNAELLGLELSIPGAWAAWSILAKATLGVAAAVVFAWSTPVADMLASLERLHVPQVIVAIAGFMIRYLDLLTGDLQRLQIARVSRCDDPRWFWQGRAVAATAGTLFIRSFERGERVHRAMRSRGFGGRFPATGTGPPESREWFPAVLWPAAAWVVALAAIAL